jgi:hypothetical protein
MSVYLEITVWDLFFKLFKIIKAKSGSNNWFRCFFNWVLNSKSIYLFTIQNTKTMIIINFFQLVGIQLLQKKNGCQIEKFDSRQC